MILISDKRTRILIPTGKPGISHIITGSHEGLVVVEKALQASQCLEACQIALAVAGREVARQLERVDHFALALLQEQERTKELQEQLGLMGMGRVS